MKMKLATTYTDLSASSGDKGPPTNGYCCHPGGRRITCLDGQSKILYMFYDVLHQLEEYLVAQISHSYLLNITISIGRTLTSR